jgi:serine/threonine protein kinase
MAPEVVDMSGHGVQADIWSLGCCVIEMLTSKPPWSEFSDDPQTIMDLIKVSDETPSIPSSVSKECKRFLKYCFQRNPFERPSAEELLYHPFVLSKCS